MCMRAVGVAMLVGMVLSGCGTAKDEALVGRPAPASASPSQYASVDVYAVSNTTSEADGPARARTEAAIEKCLAEPGVTSRREARPPARHIVSLTASATGRFEACISSTAGAALTPYAADEGDLEPGQQVALNHCGVVNVQYEGQEWEVEDIPFDGTNAPDTFSGFGSFDRRGESLIFTDDKGATLTFVRWDGTPNPYICG
mgnify:CR=1 FL=1